MLFLSFGPKPEIVTCVCRRAAARAFARWARWCRLLPDGILYTKVRAEDVAEIVEQTLVAARLSTGCSTWIPRRASSCRGIEDNPFYQRQHRLVLKECGFLDPEDIHEYMLHGGYAAAKKAFLEMSPEEICKTDQSSPGCAGRGGGGFPTGRKWEAARVQKAAKKYVICNGDEGDPGAFMNRWVMEGNPHSVIEGLMIAARAIGADETLVYVRAEYPLAVERMRARGCRCRARRHPGQQRLRHRPLAEVRRDGRRGGVCVRRRDRDDRLDRRAARHADAQAAFPGAKRALGQADHHQQR